MMTFAKIMGGAWFFLAALTWVASPSNTTFFWGTFILANVWLGVNYIEELPRDNYETH